MECSCIGYLHIARPAKVAMSCTSYLFCKDQHGLRPQRNGTMMNSKFEFAPAGDKINEFWYCAQVAFWGKPTQVSSRLCGLQASQGPFARTIWKIESIIIL